jgi:hypothetical protein
VTVSQSEIVETAVVEEESPLDVTNTLVVVEHISAVSVVQLDDGSSEYVS